MIRFGLEIVASIMFPDDDPYRLALFAHVVSVRISLYVCDGSFFGIAPSATANGLNSPMAILMVRKFRNARDLTSSHELSHHVAGPLLTADEFGLIVRVLVSPIPASGP